MPAWVQTAVIPTLPNPSLACQRAVSSQGCLAHFWNKANQRYESYESYYESYESYVHYESYESYEYTTNHTSRTSTPRIIRYGSKVYHWRIGCSVSRFCRSVISLARDRTLYCPANILTCTPILITFVHSNDSSPILITFVHSNDSSPILITFIHSNDSSPILITFVHSEGVRRILGNDVQSAEMDMDRPGSGKHHSLAARPRHDNAGRYKNVSVAVVCSVPPIRTRSNRSNKVEAGPRLHLCSNHLPNGGTLA